VQGLVEQGVLVRAGAGGAPPPVARLARPLADIQVPATVQAVLTARIDRLPAAEKALLQTLAVVGKTFAWSLLAPVVAQPGGEVLGRLAHLRAAEFLYEQPAFPESAYTFKHALTQEVAYNSLLLERRQALHERTAQAIEALYADRLAEHYEALAHHYSRSGNTQKAVDYLQRAGQQAAQRSVLAEAITHLTAALDLLQTLPESPERVQQELALQLSLGSTLSVARGGRAAPEVQQAYSRAYALCQQVGETPQVFQALRGLCMFALTRAEHARGQDLAEQLLSLAQRWGDPAFELPARLVLGAVLLWQGEGVAARDHLEASLRLYDPQQHRDTAVLYGIEHGVGVGANLGLVLWVLGYADQALQHLHRARALARDLAHPNTLQYVLTLTAIGHHFRREVRDVQEQAELAMALINEQGLASNFLAMATCLQGWALATQDQREAGLAQIRQGLSIHQTSGQEVQRPWLLGMLAEACAHAGQLDEGLRLVTEALERAQQSGERVWEAELYRIQGEMLVQAEGDVQRAAVTAEACFQQAL